MVEKLDKPHKYEKQQVINNKEDIGTCSNGDCRMDNILNPKDKIRETVNQIARR